MYFWFFATLAEGAPVVEGAAHEVRGDSRTLVTANSAVRGYWENAYFVRGSFALRHVLSMSGGEQYFSVPSVALWLALLRFRLVAEVADDLEPMAAHLEAESSQLGDEVRREAVDQVGGVG